jgi:acetyl-CoA carboxylase carboxyl transferase subunit alpha
MTETVRSKTRAPLENSKEPSPRPQKMFQERVQEAWTVVEKSRHPMRPHSVEYLPRIFSDWEELRGDRRFGEDAAISAGMGELAHPVNGKKISAFFIAHQKGRSTKQKIERNFGMAKPEGYRKALRVFEMAERFNKPIVTLIDTPGAYPGIGAEERGQSEAIAASILKMFELRVPCVGAVIGEGGSGGALALGVLDTLIMLENSTYSVISPESCAAILWGSAGESKRAALALKLGAKDVFSLGLCDEVLAEPGEGAHSDSVEAGKRLAARISHHLGRLVRLNPNELVELRYQKFRKIDAQHLQLKR